MAFTSTTVNSAAAWRPDLYTYEPETVLADAAIMAHSTSGGVIQGDAPAIRVAFVHDDTAEFYDEGTDIDEGTPGLSEAVVHTRKFAQLIRISREQYSQVGTPEHLAYSVNRSMILKADSAFLAQPAPVSPANAPAPGLACWSGLVSGIVGSDLDALVDLDATVRANLANPTAIIVSPTAWAALRKLKTGSTFNSTLLGAGTEDAPPMLLSLPVVVNPLMPDRTGLLIDRNSIISAVSPLVVATSLDQYFASDSIGVRAIWRTGHVVTRPERIGLFALPKQWTVTLGSASAGNFTLSHNGNPTGNIAYNASAATVKAALAGISDSWTATQWTVTGSAGGPYTVTSPGGTLTGSGSGLTGGTFSVAAA